TPTNATGDGPPECELNKASQILSATSCAVTAFVIASRCQCSHLPILAERREKVHPRNLPARHRGWFPVATSDHHLWSLQQTHTPPRSRPWLNLPQSHR